jgi:hypothetical protein
MLTSDTQFKGHCIEFKRQVVAGGAEVRIRHHHRIASRLTKHWPALASSSRLLRAQPAGQDQRSTDQLTRPPAPQGVGRA